MVDSAVQEYIKLIFLTPSPDLSADLLKSDNELEKYAKQIRRLLKEKGIRLADSYQSFKMKAVAGDTLVQYLSQRNHPNHKGHQLNTDGIVKYFL